MHPDQMVRAVGVAGIVAAFALYGILGDINGPITFPIVGPMHPLVLVVLGILTLVSPEWIDQLPFGPTRSE